MSEQTYPADVTPGSRDCRPSAKCDHDLHERITEWSDGRGAAADVPDAMRTAARRIREDGAS